MGVQEIKLDLDLRKPTFVLEIRSEASIFACLLEVQAVAGTIQEHFAVRAATHGTNAGMKRWAEALLLTSLARGTVQLGMLSCLARDHFFRTLRPGGAPA